MPAFSAATTQLSAKDAAANDVMGADDVSAALSKGMLLSEVASLRAYLGSTQENADTSGVYYEPITRRTTGTPATGFGYGWRVTIQTDGAATPNTEIAGSWRIESTDLTGGSEDFKWVFGGMVAGAAITDWIEFDKDGFNAPTGKVYKVAGTQVVGARNTGWTTFAGSGNKNASGINTGTITATDGNIQALSAVVKSMMDAMITHGLIGA